MKSFFRLISIGLMMVGAGWAVPCGAGFISSYAPPSVEVSGSDVGLSVFGPIFSVDVDETLVSAGFHSEISWGDGSVRDVFDREGPSFQTNLLGHSYSSPGTYFGEVFTYAFMSSYFSVPTSDITFDTTFLESFAVIIEPITSPVPEPETYAMLLAGLGFLGFMARRRKLKEAASA